MRQWLYVPQLTLALHARLSQNLGRGEQDGSMDEALILVDRTDRHAGTTPVDYQNHMLPQVSRTFALTIPQLPAELQTAVANAYLLCRMADTIEDEPGLTVVQKHSFQSAFLDVVMGKADAGRLSDELSQHLTEQTLAAERDLIRHMPQVLAVTATLNATQRNATLACLTVMTQGMAEFQNKASLLGLADRQELDRYCYCVAGCVGETLTEFFIDYAPELGPQRQTLRTLARSFGAGLQLTNILKDQRADAERGVCWLPRDLLDAHHVEPGQLQVGDRHPGHNQVIAELVGTANVHLSRALEFTLLIPARHSGIRRFLAWTIGLALLTLRNVQARPDAPVKVSHAEVAWILRLTRLSQRSNIGLRMLHKLASSRLPVTPLEAD